MSNRFADAVAEQRSRHSPTVHPRTTHEDLLDIYNARAEEFGCGFLLAGEFYDAEDLVVDGKFAYDHVSGTFALQQPESAGGHIVLLRTRCEIPRFGCTVTIYRVDAVVPVAAIEAAFINLVSRE